MAVILIPNSPPAPCSVSPALAGSTLRLVTVGAFIAKILNLIFEDVPIVFGERSREFVRAVVAADEIEVVDVGRLGDRLERCASGIRNRSGWQPGVAVGVVRGV